MADIAFAVVLMAQKRHSFDHSFEHVHLGLKAPIGHRASPECAGLAALVRLARGGQVLHPWLGDVHDSLTKGAAFG